MRELVYHNVHALVVTVKVVAAVAAKLTYVAVQSWVVDDSVAAVAVALAVAAAAAIAVAVAFAVEVEFECVISAAGTADSSAAYMKGMVEEAYLVIQMPTTAD